MHVELALVADSEPSELVEPGETALDHPSMAAKLLTGLDAAPGDARLDLTAMASTAAATVIIRLVGV